MKTFTVLMLAALSAQIPAADTAALGTDTRPCTQEGGAYPLAEQGSYSPLAPHRPTI